MIIEKLFIKTWKFETNTWINEKKCGEIRKNMEI